MRALALAFCLALTACGGGSPADKAHHTLSAITEVADPVYGATVRTCHSLELAVVEREGTTEAEDLAEVGKIRERCDALFNQLERLARLQVEARRVIDAFEAGDSTAEDVDAAVAAVSVLWAETRSLLVELEVF